MRQEPKNDYFIEAINTTGGGGGVVNIIYKRDYSADQFRTFGTVIAMT